MVGVMVVMVTSFKRRSCQLAEIRQFPGLLRSEPLSMCQATADPCLRRIHSNTQRRSGSVSVGSLGPGVHKVLFEPSERLWKV